jgi:hypothetical protein
MTAALPERNLPRRTLLRARVPDNYRVTHATIGDQTLPVDDRGTVDLTGQKSAVSVVFHVVKQ